MKTITVRQPWADLILRGEKDVENRTWPTSHRGPLLIHASAKLEQRRAIGLCYGPSHQWQLGGVVGIVDLVDCVQGHPSPWAADTGWNWVLANPRFTCFVPCKGKLQLFETEWLPSSADGQRPAGRDERPMPPVSTLFEETTAVADIAHVLSESALETIATTLGMTLSGRGSALRASFVAHFSKRTGSVVSNLSDDDVILLAQSVGAPPGTGLRAFKPWVNAIGGWSDDECIDDPLEYRVETSKTNAEDDSTDS